MDCTGFKVALHLSNKHSKAGTPRRPNWLQFSRYKNITFSLSLCHLARSQGSLESFKSKNDAPREDDLLIDLARIKARKQVETR